MTDPTDCKAMHREHRMEKLEGASEGAPSDPTGPAKVVAAVPTGWGALLSEWKRRLRRLDNDSWHYPTKQRGNELRRCIRELKRALRGHPNIVDDRRGVSHVRSGPSLGASEK